MKRSITNIILASLVLFFFTGCDRDSGFDGMIDGNDDPEVVLDGTLTAAKTSSAMTIDGLGDESIWDDIDPVYYTATVADIPAFIGYGNRSYAGQVKAAYDDQNLYMLFQYNDGTFSTDREPWYFDTASGKWTYESRFPQFDESGFMTRRGYYEDKLSVMWEATPVEGFFEAGCAVACHTGLSPFQSEGGKSALKYTNNYGEIMDMWHFKYVRTSGNWARVMDDQYTDWGSTNKNGGRHGDPGTAHYSTNKKTVNGMSVPKYVVPGATETYHWITGDQVANGEAQEVMDVLPNGNLVLANGAVIDVSNAEFQRDGGLLVPSIYSKTAAGDRADIEAIANYSGGIWTVEIRRSLVTGSEKDVQFDDMTDTYAFGIAIFDNAGIAHASTGVRYLNFK